MPFLKKDLTHEIYLEKQGTLASRIDFAWGIYQSRENTEKKKQALKFLIYALNIKESENINVQLIHLMNERDQYKKSNPEYIPGKSPSHMLFDSKSTILKKTHQYGVVDSTVIEKPAIESAIQQKELLDVSPGSKESDEKRNTRF